MQHMLAAAGTTCTRVRTKAGMHTFTQRTHIYMHAAHACSSWYNLHTRAYKSRYAHIHTQRTNIYMHAANACSSWYHMRTCAYKSRYAHITHRYHASTCMQHVPAAAGTTCAHGWPLQRQIPHAASPGLPDHPQCCPHEICQGLWPHCQTCASAAAHPCRKIEAEEGVYVVVKRDVKAVVEFRVVAALQGISKYCYALLRREGRFHYVFII